MNSIMALLDKSDYSNYSDFLNFQIDGYFLDEKLSELYPGNLYKGLIPTLVFSMEDEKESQIVWDRILPEPHQQTVCPILMCPDDRDFSCTLIVALIKNEKDRISWEKIGLDRTKELEPEKVGSNVDWFDSIESFSFAKEEYKKMIQKFKEDFEMDNKKWLEEQNS